MREPLVTVLIDTYNYGRYIEEAIDSVLAQDFPMGQVEIVVVDDGSTDDTAERLNRYGSKIRYFCKANGGQASAFNLGFQQARAEIVALLDADDYFLPGKLRRIVEEFESHPQAAMIYHGRLELSTEYNEIVERKAKSFSGFLPDDRKKLLEYAMYPTSCLAFRRRRVEQLLPVPESIRLQADVFFVLLMILVAPVLGLPDALSVYRIHGENLHYATEETITVEHKWRNNEMFLLVVREAKAWCGRHKRQLKRLDVRLLLGGWYLLLTEEQFRIHPPGKMRFFWFVLQQNYVYSSEQRWRATTLNYLTAVSALVFGYGRAHQMREWRDKTAKAMSRLYARVFRARSNPGSRGTAGI